MKNLFTKRFFLLVIPFATLFTLLNRFSLYFPFIEPEQKVIVWATNFKEMVISRDKARTEKKLKLLSDNFLLINTTHDMDKSCGLMSDRFCSDTSLKNPVPCQTIVDRSRLITLFKWLYEHQKEYDIIVCDLLFENPSNSRLIDDSLGRYINMLEATQRIVFAGRFKENDGEYEKLLFTRYMEAQHLGAVNADPVNDLLFSYRLTYENAKIKSLPIVMYEKIHHTKITRGNFGFLNYKSSTGNEIRGDNLFIPEMYYSVDDINNLYSPDQPGEELHLDSSIGKMDLWQAVKQCQDIPGFFLQESLRTNGPTKKYIFIGAFTQDHSDMHNTLYGRFDGGLILLNIYFSLLHGGNLVYWSLQLFIFICFCYIFIRVFISTPAEIHQTMSFWRHVKAWALEESPYLLLILMTLVANICYGQVTNVIILIVIIAEVERLSKMTNNWSFIKW